MRPPDKNMQPPQFYPTPKSRLKAYLAFGFGLCICALLALSGLHLWRINIYNKQFDNLIEQQRLFSICSRICVGLGHQSQSLLSLVYQNKTGGKEKFFQSEKEILDLMREINSADRLPEVIRQQLLKLQQIASHLNKTGEQVFDLLDKGELHEARMTAEAFTRPTLENEIWSQTLFFVEEAKASFEQTKKNWIRREKTIGVAGNAAIVVFLLVVLLSSMALAKKTLHAEREVLKTSEERYRAVFDNSYDAILVATRQGQIVDANNQASMLFGYPMGELLKLRLGDILSSEAAKKGSRQEEAGYYHGIRKVNLKNKTVNWIDVTARLFSLNGSRLMVIHARDITENRKSEEEKENLRAQLLHAQKIQAIGTLAGGIAHDFNNIIQAILGFSELSMDDLPEGSLARANLEEVIKAAHRARDLVQQILTFSRQNEHERKPVQIDLIVKETLKLLRATLPATIEIRENIDTRCGAVLADPTQMHQVMMNLCTNADHAMRERGGVLGVSLDVVYVDAGFPGRVRINLHEGSYLRLTLSDTGHGMDRATLERIFEPFFTTKAVDEGTGMGLATAHGIVTSHKGAITAYSELGMGTTFHVYLPRLESPAIQEDGLTPEPIPKGKERILFVDDEEPLARMGQQILEQLGYDVTARTSSEEALEAFRRQTEKFDLVITDQTMPNMTGAELAEKLMDIRSDIPIILCTGFSHIITQEKARALGICDFVMKPVVRAKLGQTVRRVLDDSMSFTKQPVL